MSQDEENQTRKSKFLHFIAVDIVESSGKETSSLDHVKKSESLRKVLLNCPKYVQAMEKNYRSKDEGDGIFIGFPESVEDPIELALEIHSNLRKLKDNEIPNPPVRIGLHSGSVYEVGKGLTLKPDIRGWGVIGVHRVMSFGDENHILASHWIANELLELNKSEYSMVNHPIGDRLDKDGKVFFLYNIYTDELGNPRDPTAPKVRKLDYLKYYDSLRTKMIGISDVKLPYIELWSRHPKGIEWDQLDCRFHTDSFEYEPLLLPTMRELSDWLRLDRRVGNRLMGRLHHINEENGNLELHFQETRYRYSLLTNFYLDVEFDSSPNLRDVLASDNMPDLDSPENKCSNHLGVNCIIETADNPPIIFLQKRSSEVAVFWNVYGASVGAGLGLESARKLEVGKMNPPSPFQELITEIIDELGIMPWEIETLRMMALCRELETGGKPTSFFVGKTKLEFDEIQRRFDEDYPQGKWETEFLEPIPLKNRKVVEKLISDSVYNNIEMSGPARANLYYYLIWKQS